MKFVYFSHKDLGRSYYISIHHDLKGTYNMYVYDEEHKEITLPSLNYLEGMKFIALDNFPWEKE